MVLNTFARSLLAVNTPCYFHTCQIMIHGLIRPKLALYTKIYSYVRRYFTVRVILETQWDVFHLVSPFYPVRTREILMDRESLITPVNTQNVSVNKIVDASSF